MLDEIGRRRSDRILAPVRIRVTGHDSSGVRFEEETLTACINKHGASISLSHSLRPEDRVRIENLATGTEGEFRVVGVSQQLFGSRREWGVEALNPEVNIWGVEFPSPSEGIQPKGLIQCKACRKVTLTPLSAIEYGVLLSQGQISRHCDGCDVTTRWQPSEEPAAAQVAQMATNPVAPGERSAEATGASTWRCAFGFATAGVK